MLPQSSTPVSFEKFAYDAIKKAILEFRFKPGDSLVEAELSKQLNISKTPVRDALTRLEREGLVTKVAYTGTYVSEITVQSVIEIFEIRAVLEGLAARQATANFSPDDLQQAEKLLILQADLLARGDLSDASEVNHQFHSLIVQRSNNQHLRSMLANLDDHIQRYRVLSKAQRGAQSTSVQEHRHVLDAIRAGDGDGAEAAMKTHLRNVLTELENVDIQALIAVVTQFAATDHPQGFSE
jgi:DNA-binding GntR family transcriptional regulator